MKKNKIQVMGSGCPGCKKLYEKVEKIVSEIDNQLEVVYETDITKLIELGAMSSPALVINGKIIFAVNTPDDEEIKELIKSELK